MEPFCARCNRAPWAEATVRRRRLQSEKLAGNEQVIRVVSPSWLEFRWIREDPLVIVFVNDQLYVDVPWIDEFVEVLDGQANDALHRVAGMLVVEQILRIDEHDLG